MSAAAGEDALERELRAALGRPARAEPDLDFHRRLRSRLQREEPQRRIESRLRLLRLYWVSFVAASFLILALLPWGPALVSGPFLFALGAIGVACLTPALLLRRLGWAALLLDALGDPIRR